MKHHAVAELPSAGRTINALPKTSKFVLLIIFVTLIFFTVTPVLYPLLNYPIYLLQSSFTSKSSSSTYEIPQQQEKDIHASDQSENVCDIFSGEWVRNTDPPYYTNMTCSALIHDHQFCMKYGRPDTDFMKWKWKPYGCELPVFDPSQFLEIVKGKSLAFVADSLGRNQIQSLICLLSRVEYPIDVSYTPDDYFKRWKYKTYNFTIAYFWAPYLVKYKERDPSAQYTGLINLYLDEFNEKWTSQIDGFDYLIISSGHWFISRPAVFYENHQIVGCHDCQLQNVTDLTKFYAYRKALRTAFKAINNLENFKGITFLRSFSPSHFENGLWSNGGTCNRTKPFRSNETVLGGDNLETYMIQMEELRAAEKEGRKRGKKYRMLDITQAMLLRPDAHPSKYGYWASKKVMFNDCLHWCLPGPIDTWNEILLQVLKIEGTR
ncbi:hypothetical protein CCACVL1_04064 [Corchorus capsularis]|uniref:Uncharacterized protein n=1 Tax=Corchorus capsularis TaxID=210143 RepID=A0A1R3JVB6_COCAP|nr:hypothetical protein CCACVL1_04064 [Corchorus capsularis]